MDRDLLNRLAGETWYYEIELAQGLMTAGRPRANLAVTRDFAKRIDVRGRSCLDIGTQEFVCPILLKRRGAARVDAYDRLSLESRCLTLQQIYGVEFNYWHGLPVTQLQSRLKQSGQTPLYDFVNFAGVLYHMVDPLAGLAIARSFVRTGGLLLLETSVKRSREHTLDFNAGGQFYPGSNYFQVSVTTIDYWLRMLRLQALDCAWWGGREIGRLLVVCRAVDDVLPDPGDDWMKLGFIEKDLEPFGLDYRALGNELGEVPYVPRSDLEPTFRAGGSSIDLFATLEQGTDYPVNDARTRLRLSDNA